MAAVCSSISLFLLALKALSSLYKCQNDLISLPDKQDGSNKDQL